MPSEISEYKTKIRNKLRKFKDNKIKLERDVFFVPGWTDQTCICWTVPYSEQGKDRTEGWEYTVKDWEYILENPERMHYLKLAEDENNIKIKTNDEGKIKKVDYSSDPSNNYTNFFQFAELVKSKIRATGVKEFDLVGHSMGGLDIISAAVLDPEIDDYPEVKEFIKTKPLEGLGLLITIASPYKGSGPANLVKHTQFDEWLRPKWPKGTREQCNNMAFDSPFIQIINNEIIRKRLLKNASIEVHTFSGANDRAVNPEYTIIKGAKNHKPFELVGHSQRMGITQDPRFHYDLFKLLK